MKRAPLFLGISLVAFSIFFNITLNGCSSGGYEITTKLVTSKWQLEKLNGADFSLPEGKTVTLEINSDEGIAFGKAPCNTYSCGYEQSGSRMKFGTVKLTKMSCDEMSKEIDYINMLGKVTEYKISSNKLYLYDGSAVIAEFKKAL